MTGFSRALAAALALASFGLVACAPPSGSEKTATGSATAAAAPAPFVAVAGPAERVAPISDADKQELGAALGVVKLDTLPNISQVATVRVFGFGGGDPAMNGLKTYIAFVTPHTDQAFMLGDFYEYRVVAARPGRVDLEIDDHILNDAGDVTVRTRRFIVGWTETPQADSPEPELPSAVTLTLAE